MFDADALKPASLGERHMIDGKDVHRSAVLAVTELFGTLHVSQNAVVQHNGGHFEVGTGRDFHLRPDMRKPAVAGNAVDGGFRFGDGGTQRHRQAPAEPGHAARRDEPHPAAQRHEVVRRPDGREAGVRHNNAFRREHGLQGRHDLRGMERLTGVA